MLYMLYMLYIIIPDVKCYLFKTYCSSTWFDSTRSSTNKLKLRIITVFADF